MSLGITIKPMGGLGNQLFQYAVGRKASVTHNVPLYADLRHFSQSSLREYQLDTFASLIETRPIGFAESLLIKGLSVADRMRTDSAHSRNPVFLGLGRERGHRFNHRFQLLPPRATLRGYFQSWRYLDGQEAEITSELRTISRPTEWFQSQERTLADFGSFTAIHVRLGDYLLDPNFGHLTDEYFKSGLDMLGAEAERYVVFSDEPSRVARLPFISRLGRKRVVLIEPPSQSPPIESLNLMALARNVVISNSTFGWWGAWLGREKNQGSVIVPTPWLLNTKFYEDDLIPPTWIRLSAMPSDLWSDYSQSRTEKNAAT